MEGKQIIGHCIFDTLLTKYVPHILENIFFSLDYKSFKSCLQVNRKWKELIMSEAYKIKGKFVFHDEIKNKEDRYSPYYLLM